MGNGRGGQLRAQKTEASEKQSYLKHTEERRGPIQLALTYRSHPVNGKDGAMGREKERWVWRRKWVRGPANVTLAPKEIRARR